MTSGYGATTASLTEADHHRRAMGRQGSSGGDDGIPFAPWPKHMARLDCRLQE